jgi:hypothetical protein
MDGMVRKFERLWCSKRLVYKPMTETDETKDLVFDLITDPVLNGLGDPGVRVPKARVDSDETVKIFCERMLLALLICLPAEKKQETKEGAANTTTASPKPDSPSATAVTPNPGNPIGYIVLSGPAPHIHRHGVVQRAGGASVREHGVCAGVEGEAYGVYGFSVV